LNALVGIEPYEVQQALGYRHRWPQATIDPQTGLRVLTIWGRTRQGRALAVTVRQLGNFNQKIIGVRDMAPEELAEYTRWEQTR
jgi:hypothetical protein